jgi:cell volume regulation protein A
MTEEVENIFLIGSILLIISLFTSKTSARFGIPTLIFFLLVGILAGSEGIGKIEFEDAGLAQILGIIALNFILFSGGLDTRLESIKPVIWRGISLSTIGIVITAGTVGLFVHAISDFTLAEGLLLGSIVSATDASAVFSIIRSRNIGLKGFIRPTLELESGSNDPMAYILTISITAFIAHGNMTWYELLLSFLMQMVIGAISGYLLGQLMVWVINRIALDTEGLYPVLVMAFIFFTYSFTHFVHGNGFLAIYLAGLVLGNSNFIHKKSLVRFYDGQAWLMQIIMFLTLGLLVFPSNIYPIMWLGILVSVVLIFVARPLAVFISLSFFDIRLREKIFISWVGLRGAVPIVFATFPMLEHINKASMIFHLVFFISTTSVLIQGTTLPVVAKWLKLIVPARVKKKSALDLELSESSKTELVEIVIQTENHMIGKSVVQLDIPTTAFIVLISRDNKYLQPNGSTVLAEGDKLLVMAKEKDILKEVYHKLDVDMPDQDEDGDPLTQDGDTLTKKDASLVIEVILPSQDGLSKTIGKDMQTEKDQRS